jgi:hypothetical protein
MPNNKSGLTKKEIAKMDKIREKLFKKYNIKEEDLTDERTTEIQERLMKKYNIPENNPNCNVDEIIAKVYTDIAKRKALMKDWNIE